MRGEGRLRPIGIGLLASFCLEGCYCSNSDTEKPIGTIESKSLRVTVYERHRRHVYLGIGCKGHGGRGNPGSPAWVNESETSYQLRLEARSEGNPVQVLGFQAPRRGSGFEKIESCSDDKGRMAFRGAPVTGKPEWTRAWTFPGFVVVAEEPFASDDCAAALSDAPTADAWLERTLKKGGAKADNAFSVAVTSPKHRELALDLVLAQEEGVVLPPDAVATLASAIGAETVLSKRLLTALSPLTEHAPSESARWNVETLVDAVPDEAAREAARAALEACRNQLSAGCTNLRIATSAHVASKLRDQKLCDAALGVVSPLVSAAKSKLALDVLEKTRSCGSPAAVQSAKAAVCKVEDCGKD